MVLNDLSKIRLLLPLHYKCKIVKNGIECSSTIGIETEKEWEYFKSNIRFIFKRRFQEIFHYVNYNHVNFVVHIKQVKKPRYTKKK